MMIKTLEDTISQTVRLEDVVVRYTELYRGSKSGKTLKCNCLFHEDDCKSFKIKVTEQIYECSACNETGNVINLVQNLIGCRKKEALYILADWFHIEVDDAEYLVPEKEMHQPKEYLKKNRRLVSIHENRKLNMIFQSLNFCRSDNPLFTAGHKCLELRVFPDIVPENFMEFAGKIAFPVRNETGMLQGFIFYLSGDKEQECLSYPQGLVDNNLLGLYQAAEAIEKIGFVYLVWDCKDLLVMHAAGFSNTVACCGKGLTGHQIKLLLKYTDQVVILYSSEIFKQVKTTKAIANLTFASVTPYRFPLNKKGLYSLYIRVGQQKFEYYIRQSTRLNFLSELKDDLFFQYQTVTEQLPDAETLGEKAKLRSDLIFLRNKLDKLSNILNEYYEYLYQNFE